MELAGALVSELQMRDRKLFDQLMEKHHKQAYNVAYRMAGNRSDAEDITQEAFIRAYRFFGKYNRDLPFDAWLYRIMSRVFVDKLRKKPKFYIQSLDQPISTDSSEYYFEVADDSNSPEQMMLVRNLDAKIQEALQKMPVAFRMTVVYADIEGLSYEEIAEVTGVNIGTVRSRLHRGRKILRDLLGDLEQYI